MRIWFYKLFLNNNLLTFAWDVVVVGHRWIHESWNVAFTFPLKQTCKRSTHDPLTGLYQENTCCTVHFCSVVHSFLRRCHDLVYFVGDVTFIFLPFELETVWWKTFGKAGEGSLVFPTRGGRHAESWQPRNRRHWKTNTHTKICMQKQGIIHIYAEAEVNNVLHVIFIYFRPAMSLSLLLLCTYVCHATCTHTHA